MMDQFMFWELSTMVTKQCLVVLTRNVKTPSYQLLLKEKMVPNVGKQFDGNFFVGAQQCSCSQNMKIPAIPGKSGNYSFASASTFAIPELYKTLLGHVGPGCEHEVCSTN